MSHLGLTHKNYAHPVLLKQLIERYPPTVSRWKLWWVKLWGVKRVSTDWNTVVTTYYYRGVFYVTDVRNANAQ